MVKESTEAAQGVCDECQMIYDRKDMGQFSETELVGHHHGGNISAGANLRDVRVGGDHRKYYAKKTKWICVPCQRKIVARHKAIKAKKEAVEAAKSPLYKILRGVFRLTWMWPLIAIPMWIVGSFLGGVFESALFLTIPVDTLVNSIEHGTEFYRYRHLVGEGSIRLMSTLDVVIGFGLPYVIGALIRRLFSGSWTRI